MMRKVEESRTPVGLLAWHPDRLARNSVDGGLIIYSIDQGKIASLRFPTFWFEPTPQELFMLQVAFGQSKYYSDNLSENVKRGIRQKLRRGEWPGLAPIGYTNNLKTHNIEPDPVKAKVVEKAFEEFAEGQHTLESLSERLSFWGVVSKTGRHVAKSMLQRMLANPAYIGLIKRDGECHEGNFRPIVSRATFEAVQKVLKKNLVLAKASSRMVSRSSGYSAVASAEERSPLNTASTAGERSTPTTAAPKSLGIACRSICKSGCLRTRSKKGFKPSLCAKTGKRGC